MRGEAEHSAALHLLIRPVVPSSRTATRAGQCGGCPVRRAASPGPVPCSRPRSRRPARTSRSGSRPGHRAARSWRPSWQPRGHCGSRTGTRVGAASSPGEPTCRPVRGTAPTLSPGAPCWPRRSGATAIGASARTSPARTGHRLRVERRHGAAPSDHRPPAAAAAGGGDHSRASRPGVHPRDPMRRPWCAGADGRPARRSSG